MGNQGSAELLGPTNGFEFGSNVAKPSGYMWVSPPHSETEYSSNDWDWFLTELTIKFTTREEEIGRHKKYISPVRFHGSKYRHFIHFLAREGVNISEESLQYDPPEGFDGTSNNTVDVNTPGLTNGGEFSYDPVKWTADPGYALTGIQLGFKDEYILSMAFFSRPVMDLSKNESLTKMQRIVFSDYHTKENDDGRDILTADKYSPIYGASTFSGQVYNEFMGPPVTFLREIGLHVRNYMGVCAPLVLGTPDEILHAAHVSGSTFGKLFRKVMTRETISTDHWYVSDVAAMFYKIDGSGQVEKPVDKPYLYDYYNWMLQYWASQFVDPTNPTKDLSKANPPLPELLYCMYPQWAPITTFIGAAEFLRSHLTNPALLAGSSSVTCWSGICNADKRSANRSHLLTTSLIDDVCTGPANLTICLTENVVIDSTNTNIPHQAITQICGGKDPTIKDGDSDSGNIFSNFLAWIFDSPEHIVITIMVMFGIILTFFSIFQIHGDSGKHYNDDDYHHDNNNSNHKEHKRKRKSVSKAKKN